MQERKNKKVEVTDRKQIAKDINHNYVNNYINY